MAAKSKKNIPNPPRPAEFHTSPFARLKSVVVEEPKPEKAPVEPAPLPKAARPHVDDLELFRQAVAGVVPMHQTEPAAKGKTAAARTNRTMKPSGTPAVEPESQADFLQEIKRLRLDVTFEDKLPDEDELKPLGGNRLKMLKRGVISLDRQLDLHGLTRDEAIASLERFLRSARQAGEKAVLVITGKGVHSAEGPVLNQAVAAWLRDQGRALISEFAPAPKEMGGSGALVVFLRPLDKPVAR